MSQLAKNVTVLLQLAFIALICFRPCTAQATNCTQTPNNARPEITSELKQDVSTITGRVAPITAAVSHTCSARVELWLRQNSDDSKKATDDDLKKATDDQGNQMRILVATQPVVGGQFTFALPKPLTANQSLFLNEIITDTPNAGAATDESNLFSDGAFRVAALSNCTPTSADSHPQISSSVVEGTKEVKGSIGQMTPAANHVCGARVELWLLLVAPAANSAPSPNEPVNLNNSNGSQVRTLLGSATASGNQFDITLSDPLLAGQTIFLKEIPTDTASSGSDNGKVKELNPIVSENYVKVDTFGSWGLVRAYFTSGFLLSQDQGSFSQSNLFMAFTLDKTWKMPGYYFGRKTKGGSEVKQLRWPPGINSFFETRLTAIPVNSCSLPNSGTSTSSTSTSTNCSSSQTSSTSSSNLDTFLANRKTARLDVGAYIPFIMTGWTYKGSPNTLFLAPIAKIGFDTPAGSLSQAQPSTTSNGSASTPGTVTAVNPTDFYKFYTFGGRFGHYAMTSSRDEAPETLSYLDFTFGRFSNLESLVTTKAFPDSRMRLWRINVEGILKVPSTPLIIGFSANVGMNNLGAPPVVKGAGDDLRFLFGAKFDVAKLLAHISQIAP